MFWKPRTLFRNNLVLKEQNSSIMSSIVRTVFKLKIESKKFKKNTLIIQIGKNNLKYVKELLDLNNVRYRCTKLKKLLFLDKTRSNSCFLYSIEILKTKEDFSLKQFIVSLESLFGGLIAIFFNKNYYWFDILQKTIFSKNSLIDNLSPPHKKNISLTKTTKNVQIEHITLY